MQMVTDSNTRDFRKPETENLITQVRYLDLSGSLMEVLMNLGNHNDRVKMSKLVIWAMRNNIELRITRI